MKHFQKCTKNVKNRIFQNLLNFLKIWNDLGPIWGLVLGPKIQGSGPKKPVKTYGFGLKSLFQAGMNF